MRRILALAALAIGLASTPAMAGPDLTPEVFGRSDRLGGDSYALTDQIRINVKAINRSEATAVARGTDSAGRRGYMIDVVLSTDEVVPPGLAVYAPAWREDVMLRGGRISRTPDLAPGAERMFEGSLEMLGTPASPYHYLKFPIPTGTPAGNYFVCAVIDSNRVIAEDNEINNVTCHRVRLGMPMLRVPVDPLPRLPQQPRVPQQPRLPNQN